MAEHFDLIIIGSGPGGLAAALYAARGRMKTLVLEKGQNGGQAAITHLIENYPGSIEDPTGPKLTHRMLEQAKNFGAEIRKEEVVDVDFTGKEKIVKCKGAEYTAKAVVIATGATPRKLDAPGIRAVPNLDIRIRTVVQEVKGDGILESIVFKNLDTNEVYEVEADEEDGTMGLFIFIGYQPQTELFKGKVDIDEYGYIVAGESTETNVPGVFVAGDCRVKEVRQVVTATADGAVAAIMAEKYISKEFE